MSNAMKYVLLRSMGHALVLVPVVFETVSVLPYGKSEGLLATLKLTCSAALIIAAIALCLLRNILSERLKTPAPWAIACSSFLITAATRVVADKLFYITLAWALGSLAALVPYAFAERIRKNSTRP